MGCSANPARTVLLVFAWTMLSAGEPPAFPGAEGFGANARGGRGGRVVWVTTTATDGPGSLSQALVDTSGPRYILFKTSGVISLAPWRLVAGRLTLAGHSSPGGVILRGWAWNSLAPLPADWPGTQDVIIRHLRSRPDTRLTQASQWPSGHVPEDGSPQWTWGELGGSDDAIRVINARRVILDHCSFGRSTDETIQLSESSEVTIQNCILAEGVGNHYNYGGMLINYSTLRFPLNDLSVHHNLWYRIGGRLPEFTVNGGDQTAVHGATFRWEYSHNLLYDVGFPIWISVAGKPYNPTWLYGHRMNLVGNRSLTRLANNYALFSSEPLSTDRTALYVHDNVMDRFPGWTDSQVFSPYNQFATSGPNTNLGQASWQAERFPYPQPTVTPSSALRDVIRARAGAFPRDPMDNRIMTAVAGPIDDSLHYSHRPANDGLSFPWTQAPTPILDSDSDGMPDWWEVHHGLDPLVDDHAGRGLSTAFTGVAGYDNLECYLNRLSDHLVTGASLTHGEAQVWPLEVSAQVSPARVAPGGSVTLNIPKPPGVGPGASADVSLAMLQAPTAVPAPAPLSLGTSSVGWSTTLTVPTERTAGTYHLLVRVRDGMTVGYAVAVVMVGEVERSRRIVLRPVSSLPSTTWLVSQPADAAVMTSGADTVITTWRTQPTVVSPLAIGSG